MADKPKEPLLVVVPQEVGTYIQELLGCLEQYEKLLKLFVASDFFQILERHGEMPDGISANSTIDVIQRLVHWSQTLQKGSTYIDAGDRPLPPDGFSPDKMSN